MDQYLAEVYVATLTDAEQLRLTSGRVLAWQDPQPCWEVPALAECGAVADRCDDGCGYNRPNPGNLTDACASCIVGRDTLKFFNLLLNKPPLTPQHVDQVAHLWCQLCLGVLQDLCHRGLESRWLMRIHHAAFE